MPFGFDPHSSKCAICADLTDFNTVASLGKQAGYFATVNPDFVALTKLSPDCKQVQCFGAVHRNLSCELIVGCRNVTKQHLQCEQPIVKMLDLLLTHAVCKGNEGFEDMLDAKRGKEILAVFRDQKGNEISREDGSCIRHVNCLGFVDKAGDMCSNCEQYRCTLRKTRSRDKRNSSVSNTKSVCKIHVYSYI